MLSGMTCRAVVHVAVLHFFLCSLSIAMSVCIGIRAWAFISFRFIAFFGSPGTRACGVGVWASRRLERGASRGPRGSSLPYSGSGLWSSLALLVCAWRGRGPRDGGCEMRVEVRAVILGLAHGLALVLYFQSISA